MGILFFIWYTGRDSNPQPSEPESDALSIEPPVHLSLQLAYYNKLFPVSQAELSNFFSPIFRLLWKKCCFSGNAVL